jgi:serine/threonine protein kinase
MKAFTKNFRDKIGEGGFSVVYRGTAPDGSLLAVKRNKRQDKSFHQEVDMLSRVHHRRVVRFIGYCDENNKQTPHHDTRRSRKSQSLPSIHSYSRFPLTLRN